MPPAGGVTVLPTTILPVSASFVHDWLVNTYKQHCSAPLLTVHLGVDANAFGFTVEHTAYNAATFRVPDVDGYQPQKVRITQDMDLEAPLQTALPLNDVVGMRSPHRPILHTHNPSPHSRNAEAQP